MARLCTVVYCLEFSPLGSMTFISLGVDGWVGLFCVAIGFACKSPFGRAAHQKLRVPFAPGFCTKLKVLSILSPKIHRGNFKQPLVSGTDILSGGQIDPLMTSLGYTASNWTPKHIIMILHISYATQFNHLKVNLEGSENMVFSWASPREPIGLVFVWSYVCPSFSKISPTTSSWLYFILVKH